MVGKSTLQTWINVDTHLFPVFRVQGAGSGCRAQGAGCRVQDAGFRVPGAGFREGSGSRVQGVFSVQCSVYRVQGSPTGSGFRVHGSNP